MKKMMEMVCVSEMEGFNRQLYESSRQKLSKHLEKFGWTFDDCVFEEDDMVWSCKPAAIWFLIPNPKEDDWE
jgi:hypothetical protein